MSKDARLHLASPQNPLLKDVRRAAARGTLTEGGLAVAESFHLLEEALRSGLEVPSILAAESVHDAVESHVKGLRRPRVYVLPDRLFDAIASTENSRGVIALIKPVEWTLETLFRGQSMVVILDGIQDPGNAGAIVRAAEAFGATGCVFLRGAVSPYNPKTLRASAGSLFRLPHVQGVDAEIVRAIIDQKRLDLFAAVPRGGRPVGEADLSRRFAVIAGAEGQGLDRRLWAGAADLHIPTIAVDSLNVAMAAGIILYEAHRQRVRP